MEGGGRWWEESGRWYSATVCARGRGGPAALSFLSVHLFLFIHSFSRSVVVGREREREKEEETENAEVGVGERESLFLQLCELCKRCESARFELRNGIAVQVPDVEEEVREIVWERDERMRAMRVRQCVCRVCVRVGACGCVCVWCVADVRCVRARPQYRSTAEAGEVVEMSEQRRLRQECQFFLVFSFPHSCTVLEMGASPVNYGACIVRVCV